MNDTKCYKLRLIFALSGFTPLFLIYIAAVYQNGFEIFTINGLKDTFLFKGLSYFGILIFYLSIIYVIYRCIKLYTIRDNYFCVEQDGIFLEGKKVADSKNVEFSEAKIVGVFPKYLCAPTYDGKVIKINISPVDFEEHELLQRVRAIMVTGAITSK